MLTNPTILTPPTFADITHKTLTTCVDMKIDASKHPINSQAAWLSSTQTTPWPELNKPLLAVRVLFCAECWKGQLQIISWCDSPDIYQSSCVKMIQKWINAKSLKRMWNSTLHLWHENRLFRKNENHRCATLLVILSFLRY